MITQEYLKQYLHYDHENGLFKWVKPKKRGTKAGDYLGTKHNDGYLTVEINNKGYLLHRLAFLYMSGEMPINKVDHINGKRDDNRWNNLRHATDLENSQNRIKYSNNSSGYVGVYYKKSSNKWQAKIDVGNKRTYLGNYDSAFLAGQAYKEAKLKLHKYNPVQRS